MKDCPRCKGPCRYSSVRVCRALCVLNERKRRHLAWFVREGWKKMQEPIGVPQVPEFKPISREDLYTPMDF